ncbi:hypothetical protein F4Y59_03840 [Candidatus Poribacteria bacterium]|nr:hypothetical protein [Candidatus Poribacteria bacterium]MXY27281.1 hypothetical protein [Candidatus Poribacteria bacterium]MYK20223.1 hypothetical protein [Candidatus Poribacteria bacterium]
MPFRQTNFILRVITGFLSGSVDFTGNKRTTLQPAGGSFTAPFVYKIGRPASDQFIGTITGADATANVSPSAPVTQRQRMGGSPSDMEDVDPNEVQTGSVSGTVPVNSGTSVKTHTLTLRMRQPDPT